MRIGIAVYIAAGCLAVAASGAAQKPPAAPAKAPAKAAPVANLEPSLKQRIDGYYRDIQEGKKGDAFQYVAPESRNEFFNMDYNSLVGIRIKGVEYSKDGSTATVDLVRSERVPTFQQVLDLTGKDTWKKVDGQWCLVLNPPRDVQTPFGKMHFGGKAGGAEQQSPNIQQEMQKKVDPAQYRKALQEVMAGSIKPAAEEKEQKSAKKPASKKKSDESSKEKPDPSIPHP